MDIFVGLIAVALILLVAYYLGIFRGAPFLPTTHEDTQRMLDMAQVKPNDRLADLGSGDGRLLIAAARLGAEAHGYEINPLLILWSQFKIRRAGLDNKAFVHWHNYWNTDLSSYNVVVIFGITGIMDRLGRKLDKELSSGSRVICNIFPIPDWEGTKDRGIYYYHKN